MKKAVLFLLPICAAQVLCASYLILLSPSSVTNKVITLILLGFVCLSVGLPVIRELLATCDTTKKQGGLSRQKHQTVRAVPVNGQGTKNPKGTTSDWSYQDQWEELNEREGALYHNKSE